MDIEIQATSFTISSVETLRYNVKGYQRSTPVWTVRILNEDDSVLESRDFVNIVKRNEWIASFGFTPDWDK